MKNVNTRLTVSAPTGKTLSDAVCDNRQKAVGTPAKDGLINRKTGLGPQIDIRTGILFNLAPMGPKDKKWGNSPHPTEYFSPYFFRPRQPIKINFFIFPLNIV